MIGFSDKQLFENFEQLELANATNMVYLKKEKGGRTYNESDFR